MNCSMCGKEMPYNKFGTILGQKICYKCCAEIDKKQMRDEGKITLYWHNDKITNWPGSLKIKPNNISIRRHNWGLEATYVWFYFENKLWLGKHIGYNSELIHCKQLKHQPKDKK